MMIIAQIGLYFKPKREAAAIPDKAFSDYFYGDEATQFTYFRIPCQLITHPRFKHLSTNFKLLYGMLLDRMSLLFELIGMGLLFRLVADSGDGCFSPLIAPAFYLHREREWPPVWPCSILGLCTFISSVIVIITFFIMK